MTVRRRQRVRNHIETQKRHRYEMILNSWTDSLRTEHTRYSLDNLDDCWNGRLRRSAVRVLKQYVVHPNQFLILKGSAGVGKSTLAITLATYMLQNYYRVPMYRSLPSLLMSFSFPNEGNPLQEASDAPVLILDDIGAAVEGITAHQKRSLWSLIDNRWGTSNRHTIMTTNMSITSTEHGQGLRDWLGVSCWDRVQDDLKVIEFFGESFREE